ncbi:MAG: cyclic pyranopterin monophosphate synthase MoaC [Gammaproteobacteria bacterium]|nr:cyclic pyranopterin monophosphate synthase MoaC [Gammaproteobacteria bacterium]
MKKLTHINENGSAEMVDIGDKEVTRRRAVATGLIQMKPDTMTQIYEGDIAKGDTIGIARIAGIQADKNCSQLIPLCHPLSLSKIVVEFKVVSESCLRITAECMVTARTGVEMEAMTAVSVAALTIYDMCKSVDRSMTIGQIQLIAKQGGNSGSWERVEPK